MPRANAPSASAKAVRPTSPRRPWAIAERRQAKELSGEFSYIHFACHGVADQTDPLNSALILSEISTGDPATENGILQSWEVLESVRFDAELVTLSACETALGTDMGGEGIVSLVRSFQYAGASSELSSLRQVADRPNALVVHAPRHDPPDAP